MTRSILWGVLEILIRALYFIRRLKLHKSTHEWHTTSKIRMTYEYIRVTYEWHTSDIRVTYRYIRVTNNILLHASDIRMIFEYLPVTNEWYASTCKHRTNDIRVHRVKYEWHASDIQMTYEWQKHLELLDRILQHYLWQNRVMWFEIIFGYALF